MASKEELEQLTKEGDSFMKEIKKKMDKLSSDNFFENFISAEEDERKIRNTYYTNGEERGKENALIETAKNLLKVGDSIQKISEVTGLSKQKIKSLQ